MTDSTDRDVKKIHAEADEIAQIIRCLSMLDEDSREKVLATVQAYYELGQGEEPSWMKAIQDRMADENERMRENFDEMLKSGADVLYGEVRDDEEQDLRSLAFTFSQAMFEKMIKKYREEGFRGWDDQPLREELFSGLESHLKKVDKYSEKNLVDIANFCAFIWHHRRKG